MSAPGRGTRKEWPRRYPPLAVAAVALVLAVFVLPSALTLPLANPGQTLEYAPVPGNNGQAPHGNLAALGLGVTSSTGNGPGPGLGLAPPPLGIGAGGIVSDKQCVGSPPRQTEDLMSPPCVAFFSGDNGGSTYEGVTGGEIRVVFYLEGNHSAINNSHGTDTTPASTMVDLWQAPSGQEDMYVEWLRVWQSYFGSRYQTYKRKPHFFVYFNSGTDSVANVQADAAHNFADVHPFATLAYGDYAGAYATYMAQHGVLSFGGGVLNESGSDARTASDYASHPKLIWGYDPSADVQAAVFASFVCSKVQPYPSSVSGNPGENGNPRTYGLIVPQDPSLPGLTYVADKVSDEVGRCGVHFAKTVYTPTAGQAGPPASGDVSYAVQNMSAFKAAHVTTVIWPGGYESNQTAAAAEINYFPEWITWGGDHAMDEQGDGQVQDQREWSHAWNVTPDLATPGPDESSCDEAYRSVDRNASSQDLQVYACHIRWSYYDDIRQLFTGIQVAGPKLNPDSMDQGFHAIPARRSTDPQSPACFYNTGDYTCVKDAFVQWWNSASGGSQRTGCYRMVSAGRRHLPGDWPPGNVDAGSSPSDPCDQL